MSHTPTILTGTPVAAQLRARTADYVSQYIPGGSYIVIFFVSADNAAQQSYVKKKQEYGRALGVDVRVVTDVRDHASIIGQIARYNADDACVGIMLQLPLTPSLQPYTQEICDTIVPHKDIDGLTSVLPDLVLRHDLAIVPEATAAAVFHILEYYDMMPDVQSRAVVIGLGKIIGRPAVREFGRYTTHVTPVNSTTPLDDVYGACREATHIVACCGVPHLVGEQHIGDTLPVVIDVGRSKRDGMIMGDVDMMTIQHQCRGITPVPGGVGPATVASLFWNMCVLYENIDILI